MTVKYRIFLLSLRKRGMYGKYKSYADNEKYHVERRHARIKNIMGLVEFFTIIAAIATILGGVYGILKHLLKDTRKEVKILEDDYKEFKNFQRQETLEFRKEYRATNARMDGVYNLILNKLDQK